MNQHRTQPLSLSFGASEGEQHLHTGKRMHSEVLHGRGGGDHCVCGGGEGGCGQERFPGRGSV